MSPRVRIITGCLTVLFAILATLHALAVEKTTWKVDENFPGDDAREDMSGVICPADTTDWCIMVNDNKKYIQFFSYQDGQIKPLDERMRLLPKKINGEEMDEIDAEGVAYENGYVYVSGSHGLARKKKTDTFEPSRFFVFRFPVNADTDGDSADRGKPAFALSRKKTADEVERSNRLQMLLSKDPVLADYVKLSLSVNGLNIEGLAVADGMMYFGLRAPSIAGEAFIFAASIGCVFDGVDCKPDRYALALGAEDGIRDLARFGDSILVLSGPSPSEGTGQAAIWQWAADSERLKRLAGIPGSDGRKAEGLMVLPGSDRHKLRLLVVYDSEENGAPEVIVLPREQ
jgi:hypothetical protein